MCGIVAVLRRRSSRAVPAAELISGLLDQAERSVETAWSGVASADVDVLARALRAGADELVAADTALRGLPGARFLIEQPTQSTSIDARVALIEARLGEIERRLDGLDGDAAALEAV